MRKLLAWGRKISMLRLDNIGPGRPGARFTLMVRPY